MPPHSTSHASKPSPTARRSADSRRPAPASRASASAASRTRSPSIDAARRDRAAARSMAPAGSGAAALSSTTLCAIAAICQNSRHVRQPRAAAPEDHRQVRHRQRQHHRRKIRPALASDAVISICSQQIWRRCPNGIQHCENTRAASERSPVAAAAESRWRGWDAPASAPPWSRPDVLRVLGSLPPAPPASWSRRAARPCRLRPAPACRSEPTGRPVPCRICSGAMVAPITVSSRRGRAAPASRRPPSVPRSRRRNSENRTCASRQTFWIGSTTAQLASTMSCRVYSVASPMMASSSSVSYAVGDRSPKLDP